MSGKKVNHLVVDTGAFIKNIKVHEIGENIYTLSEVIDEIKDNATRERLAFLPYQLNYRQASSEAVQIVTEFSKKTGDYLSLSATDIQLLALTYLLEKEHVGTEHLRTEPVGQVKIVPKSTVVEGKPLIGFYQPENVPSEKEPQDKDNKTPSNNVDNGEENVPPGQEEPQTTDEENESPSSDLSDMDEGWITENNITEAKKQMAGLELEDSQLEVACVTTDFAMQNILLQMGLHPVSTEGMLIREAKTFIFRCHACFKTTSNMMKEFCPNCGNKTLKRVSVTVNEDGTRCIHINFKRPINIRGTRYSLPMPKGGRHSFNPILCEDQKPIQSRPSKLDLQKGKFSEDDSEYTGSPFAKNDVYSKAAHLGIRAKVNHTRRNPNEKTRCTGNRKKKS